MVPTATLAKCFTGFLVSDYSIFSFGWENSLNPNCWWSIITGSLCFYLSALIWDSNNLTGSVWKSFFFYLLLGLLLLGFFVASCFGSGNFITSFLGLFLNCWKNSFLSFSASYIWFIHSLFYGDITICDTLSLSSRIFSSYFIANTLFWHVFSVLSISFI